jgi:hypothetical protein
LEPLELRRLLHAGCDHDDLVPDVFELSGDLPPAEPLNSSDALNPLTSIPELDSFLGAADSLYLDFNGHTQSSWGSYSNITTPVFDRDGDATTFSDSELANIQSIWAQVAEDFAPFNINVTTVEPPSFSNGVAMRVSIGGGGSWTGGTYGGIAYVNSYTSSIPNVVFVFSSNLGSTKSVAEASSHEAGHGYGLQHQSLYDSNGALVQEYYTGSGGRAPIMGNSYGSSTRGLWWNGTSTSSTTIQDDLSVLSKPSNTFGYRTDDHGNTAATATALSGSGSLLTGAGILTSTSDVDYFSFSTQSGSVSFSVTVPASINNLDSRLELRTAAGDLITSAAPTNSFNATISTTLAAGSYRLVVASQANYGDIGQYSVSATVSTAAPVPQVLARRLFYNNSVYDGNDPAINAADDAAIATFKSPYFAGGGLATFTNMSTYSLGINGLMIDLANAPPSITAADFIFRVGDTNSPGTWAAAPTPTVGVRAGAGTSGSSRIELTWADEAIKNTWLQVTLRGNDAAGGFHTATGLTASDVFYFGHLIGETEVGDPTFAMNNATDEILTRNNQGIVAAISNLYDFNRDGIVDATDQLIVRFNQGFVAKINVSSPAAPEAAGGEDAPELSAVASALAARHRAVDRAVEFVDFAVPDEELVERLAARVSFARLPALGQPEHGGAVEAG